MNALDYRLRHAAVTLVTLADLLTDTGRRINQAPVTHTLAKATLHIRKAQQLVEDTLEAVKGEK